MPSRPSSLWVETLSRRSRKGVVWRTPSLTSHAAPPFSSTTTRWASPGGATTAVGEANVPMDAGVGVAARAVAAVSRRTSRATASAFARRNPGVWRRAMRVLVLASDPVDADDVRDALGADAEGAEVRVVSPALNDSPLAFWVSDADEAIAEADEAQEATVEELRSEGLEATGTIGESDPLQALEDALAMFPADHVLLFARPEDERKYKEDVLVGEAERLAGVPVTQRVVED